MDYDFGYSPANNANSSNAGDSGNGDNVTNLNTGKIDNDINKESADDLDLGIDNKPGDGNKPNDNSDNKPKDNDDNSLDAGTTIEVDGITYTVDDKGNVLDSDGNVFKEAKDVKEWIESFDKVDDNNDTISIESIQELVGINITDENGKPIQFENTPAGVKAYVDGVIEASKEEHYQTAINTLYQKYPFINDILNYYLANGNSLDGFNEIPDRSNIIIDEGDEAQQENIIRMAWKEQGRKGDVQSYINYLKSSGILLATAKEELAGLQEADAKYRERLEAEAEKKEEQRIKELQEYWDGVHDVIKNRKIAGYQIPESIIITRNNQKISVTPEDFYNYIYRVDKDGYSAYERDLAKETRESRRDDEILRAYLKFVGGNYSNLVDMAINEQKVTNLRLRSKERNKSTIRINKPDVTTKKDIDFGYK